jgi:hypothetical protein
MIYVDHLSVYEKVQEKGRFLLSSVGANMPFIFSHIPAKDPREYIRRTRPATSKRTFLFEHNALRHTLSGARC